MSTLNEEIYDSNRNLFLQKQYKNKFISHIDRSQLKRLQEENHKLLSEKAELQNMINAFSEQFTIDNKAIQEYAIYKAEITKNDEIINELKQKLSHAHDQQIFYQNKVDKYIRKANGL